MYRASITGSGSCRNWLLASLLMASATHAALITNSWTAATGLWQTAGNWSVGVPANTQAVVLVTNAASKTVTINSATPTGNLTISNLVLRGFGASTNTLQITNAPSSTLLVRNQLTVGTNAVLLVTNSTLQVDGDSFGTFDIDGAVNFDSGTIMANNASVNMSIGNVSRGSFTMKAGTLLSYRLIAGSTAGNPGTFTIAGGTNSILTQADVAFAANSTGAVWVTGGLLELIEDRLTVGGLGSGVMTISNGIVRLGVQNIGSQGRGTLTVAGGSNLVSGVFSVGFVANATGTVWITGGQVIATNATTFVGAAGIGTMAVSNGLLSARTITVGSNATARGTMTFAGGTTRLSGAFGARALALGELANATGTVWVTGGDLVYTNTGLFGPTIGRSGVGQMAISNGTVQLANVAVGELAGSRGTLTIAGGTNTFLNNFSVGSAANATGAVWITGGQILKTDLAPFLSVGGSGVGQLTISNGNVSVLGISVGGFPGSRGTLIMAGGTNVCGQLNVSGNLNATGSVFVTGGLLVVTNAQITVATRGSGLMTVSGGRVLATNVVVGEVAGSQGTLTIAGGTNAFMGPLAIGSNGFVWVTGGQLVVTNTPATVGVGNGLIIDGSVLVTNGGSLVASNVIVHVGNAGAGTLTIDGGTGWVPSLEVGSGNNSKGTIWVSNGSLTGSNTFGTTIGSGGSGELIVSNGGTVSLGLVTVGDFHNPGTLNIAGGTCRFNGQFHVGVETLVTGTVWLTSGTLVVTNSTTAIGYDAFGRMTTSNGVAAFSTVVIGNFLNSAGTVTIEGGTNAVNTRLTIGNVACSSTAQVFLRAGNLSVTNNSFTSTLAIEGGTLTQTGGSLIMDNLVITNPCARYIKTGGSFIIKGTIAFDSNLDADGDGMPNQYEIDNGLLIFDPRDADQDKDGDGQSNLDEFLAGTSPTNAASAFRVTAVTREANNIRVTWTMGPGKTNALERAAGATGSFSNNFATIFTVTNTVGTITNFLDVGAASAGSTSRYYRVRLVP